MTDAFNLEKIDMNEDNILPRRTLGDGKEATFKPLDTKVNLNKPPIHIIKSMTPILPSSKVILLVPKYTPQEKKISIISKPKEPKFVPYEPYKAAVQPIKKKTKKRVIPDVLVDVKPTKNNIEIQELVDQMTQFRTSEMDQMKMTALKEDELIPRKQWLKEKEALENDILNLKETKAHLENQVKFQAQVNSELKTLLVAAVGEDLETRVQHLTEDKLCLARALLNSANHLTSHQEQTEWLSGQCEVWRSKFLASSLMVEELARWKSSLTKRTHDLQEVIKKVMNEHSVIQNQMYAAFENLNLVYAKTSNTRCSLKNGDLLELANANMKLSEEVTKILGVKCPENLNLPTKDAYTATEKLALKILKHPVSLRSSQDHLCNALVGAAHSMTQDPKLGYSIAHPCCSHCKDSRS